MKAVLKMKKVNRFLLGAIQALVDLGIISNGLLGIGFLIVGPIYIFTNAISFKQIGNNWAIELLLYFDILLFMAVFLYGCLALHHILNNINLQKYFAPANMVALRKLMFSFLILTILDGINTVVNHFINVTTQLDFFPCGNYYAYFISLIICYLVYFIFKRGLALQNENNSII